MIEKEKGAGAVEAQNVSDEVIYKIDVPANRYFQSCFFLIYNNFRLIIILYNYVNYFYRYDLLCLEGISRALNIFLGKMAPPVFVLKNPSKLQRIIAKPEVLYCFFIIVFKFLLHD